MKCAGGDETWRRGYSLWLEVSGYWQILGRGFLLRWARSTAPKDIYTIEKYLHNHRAATFQLLVMRDSESPRNSKRNSLIGYPPHALK